MQLEAIAAERSADIGNGQRCAVRPAALDGELPPSSPGALFEVEVGSGFRVVRSIRRRASGELELPHIMAVPARAENLPIGHFFRSGGPRACPGIPRDR